MRKEILSEIDQMKYLFGYKPGKVISEQSVPTTQTKNSPYKLDVIKNEDDFKEFTDFLKLDYDPWKNSGCCNKYIQWKEKEMNALEKLQASGNKEGWKEKLDQINSVGGLVVSLIQPLLKYAAEKGVNGAGINQLGLSALGQILDQYASPELKQELGGRPVSTLIDQYFGNLSTFKSGMANYIDSKIKKLGGGPISEQAVTTNPVSGTTRVSGTTQTKNSRYKLDAIKNDEDFENFLSAANDTNAWDNVGLGNKFKEIQDGVMKKIKGADSETIQKQGEILSGSHSLIKSIIKTLLMYSAMNGKNGQMISQLDDATLLKMINLYMSPQEKENMKGAPIEKYIEAYIGDIPSFKAGISKLIDNKIKEMGG